jgi:sphingomyelin phosphodiesterase
MNYCSNLNWWLLINSTDPLGQLEWLSNILQSSENTGEKVHIIGHQNPNSCLQSWSSNYYRIINRYENTVTAQFFGHTHHDEFEIFYDMENITRATNIAFIGPSVTTFYNNNPGYRIYSVDGFYKSTTWRVTDYETYFLNLTEANLSNRPKWELEYTAKVN